MLHWLITCNFVCIAHYTEKNPSPSQSETGRYFNYGFTDERELPFIPTSFTTVASSVSTIASSTTSCIVVNVFFTVVVISQKTLHQRDLVLNMLLAVLYIIIGLVANLSHLISLITGSWVFGMPVSQEILSLGNIVAATIFPKEIVSL
ncbi:hypothetical protein EMCRGX_G004901 [Ephydatia muelleri]